MPLVLEPRALRWRAPASSRTQEGRVYVGRGDDAYARGIKDDSVKNTACSGRCARGRSGRRGQEASHRLRSEVPGAASMVRRGEVAKVHIDSSRRRSHPATGCCLSISADPELHAEGAQPACRAASHFRLRRRAVRRGLRIHHAHRGRRWSGHPATCLQLWARRSNDQDRTLGQPVRQTAGRATRPRFCASASSRPFPTRWPAARSVAGRIRRPPLTLRGDRPAGAPACA